MTRRRAGGPTSAQRRHARNADRMAIERAKDNVFTKCWICGAEFVVNNYTDQKVRTKKHELAGQLLCSTCRCNIGGRIITRAGVDWARDFMQMFLIVKKIAWMDCQAPLSEEPCKCTPCVAGRVLKEVESRRTPRRLYRRKRIIDDEN
jgi:hypothetical protein